MGNAGFSLNVLDPLRTLTMFEESSLDGFQETKAEALVGNASSVVSTVVPRKDVKV